MMNKKVSVISVFVALFAFSTMVSAEDKPIELGDVRKITTERSPVDDLPAEKLSKRAVEVLMEEMFPVENKTIKEVRKKEIERQKSFISRDEPEAINDIIMVSTKPGAKLVKVYVTPGFPTTLNLFDSTGQPWPIKNVDTIEGMDIEVKKVETDHLNAIKITAKTYAGITSMNISLVGFPSAMPMLIEVSTEKFHSSPFVQLDREGPQAKPVLVNSLSGMPGDSVLKDIVLGIAPESFEAMDTSDPHNVEAWRHDGSLYIRTQYFPAALPRAVYNGPNGYTAYKLSDSPLLTMQDQNGNIRKIQITSGDK